VACAAETCKPRLYGLARGADRSVRPTQASVECNYQEAEAVVIRPSSRAPGLRRIEGQDVAHVARLGLGSFRPGSSSSWYIRKTMGEAAMYFWNNQIYRRDEAPKGAIENVRVTSSLKR